MITPRIAVLVGGILALGQAGTPQPLDRGWRFHRVEDPRTAPDGAAAALDDGGWEEVVLPHTVRIEDPAAANRPFQGLCWYRRRLALRPEWKGKRVGIRFDGAMHRAELFVNGQPRGIHEGGYLPFFLDLSDDAKRGGEVLVALRLDNRDAPDIPPGKPMKDLDFCYFGGLHRHAWLVVSDPLRITDPVEADRPGSGGVFVRCDEATPERARLMVQTHVVNGRRGDADVRIRHTLMDGKGHVVARAMDDPSVVAPGGESTRHAELTVQGPLLWHPDHPWLYQLRTEVVAGGRVVDHHEAWVGLRRLEVRPEQGVFLNGEALKLRGANRHNDYPWLGNAIPDNAQERDARRLKAAGFNFLRLAHYPQSPAFLDACDRVGLLVAVCVPGWQWFRDTPAFQDAVRRDIRHMVRRDRNHPSLLFWETSLNETYQPQDAFYAGLVKLAHEEMPGDQCFTGGDTLGRKDAASIGYDVPYTLWTDFYDRPMAKELGARKGLHREYGDYEFGGEHSTSRMARGDGETGMRLQAWNYQWSHNRNLGWNHTLGDAIWVGIDHFRGCSEDQPISRCGSLDYLRLPKYAFHFYRSQRDPDLARSDVESGPMAFLATEWTPRPGPAKVVVFSNGDEAELFLNGRSLGRRKPDAGPDSDYKVPVPDADPNYWQKGEVTRQDAAKGARRIPEGVEALLYDGGNARNLAHPPFTFPAVPFEPGELKVIAFRAGKAVATDQRRTPGRPASLRLSIDEAGVPFKGDGSDAVFLRVELVDARGTVIPSSGMRVHLRVQGGELIGTTEATLEAGIASALLRAPRPGGLRIQAEGEGVRGCATLRAGR
jgi:beta-galactosidase